jgi:hypothetical protein
MAWTLHPGDRTAAHRIVSGRAPDLADTDAERAARVAAAHLPWLAHLDDAERAVCLDEVVATLTDDGELQPVLRKWSDVAAERRAGRADGPGRH